MDIIVKYSNRKLYSKTLTRYINLNDLALLPMGSFKVLEYGTNKDITLETLFSSLLGSPREIKITTMQHCIDVLSR